MHNLRAISTIDLQSVLDDARFGPEYLTNDFSDTWTTRNVPPRLLLVCISPNKSSVSDLRSLGLAQFESAPVRASRSEQVSASRLRISET